MPWTAVAALLVVGGLALPPSPAHAEEAPAAEPSALRRHDARLMLDYQTVRVKGDSPIDLMGLHYYAPVADGISVGAGLMGPLVSGQYGGFMAASVGVQGRLRLVGPFVALAGLSAGGGAGGRSPEHAKKLSGSGSFVRAQLGLGVELGDVTVGAGVSRLSFRRSLIDSSQLNVFVDIPFTYLSGPYDQRGEPLSATDDARAARETGESMVGLSLDNYHQLEPRAGYAGDVRTAEFQFAHFLDRDVFWFANFASAYAGLPTYNQLLGGLGRRVRLAPSWTLYAQLGIGSGGYSPEQIDTGPGLLVYPKLSAEYAISRNVGIALTAGYLAAPKGTSRNPTYGLTMTRHLGGGAREGAVTRPAVFEGLRVTVLHQSDLRLRYRDVARPPLHMLGIQVDMPVGERWYVPVQASAAYTSYLGYPGYAEVFAGLGVQSRVAPGERWQAFGQVMGGANVHGKGAKFTLGGRWLLDDRLAVSLGAGAIEARSAGGGRYSALNLVVGLDYRFSVPTR